MFGNDRAGKVMKRVRRALDEGDLKYDVDEDGHITLGAMGDDLPMGMFIVADDEHSTLNIYCYLIFDIPEDARMKLLPELNTINNQINNGAFYMDPAEPKIYFKVVQSFFETMPSVDTIKHLVLIAFQTVDVNDGKLKGLIPVAAKKDYMYS